jgi:hypothetical protein
VRRLCRALSCCVLLSGSLAQLATRAQAQAPQVRVDLSADRKELSVSENVAVRIYVQAQGAGQPDIEVPEFEGFQVVQRAVQRPMQFSFGFGQAAPVVTSTTQYTFVLVPIGPGTFKIPPVRVTFGQKVYQSQPLVLTVTGPAGAQPSAASQAPGQQPQAAQPQAAAQASPTPQATGDAWTFDPEAFLRTVVDKTEPFEGEQVTATIYLYTRHNLQQVPAVQSEASTNGMWVQDLLSPTRSLEPTRQVVNEHGYWVYVLRRFAGFPLRSGELTIGAMALTISRESVFDLFNPGRGAAADVQRSSVPILLRVKALPAERKPDGPVAVGSFEIQASLDRKQIVTGDAATLTVNVRGKGNLRGVHIADPHVNGLQILQPEVHDLIESPDDRVQGTRSFAWLIVPEAPGTYTLPAVSVATFDPEHGGYRRISSEPLTLVAAGAARSDATKTAASDDHPAGSGSQDEVWPSLRAHSELSRAQTPLAARGFYPWALLFAPLLWVGTWLLPAAWARVRRRGGESVERVALRGARKRLSEAERALVAHDARRFHADVASALQTTLEARLSETLSGLTRAELLAKLKERGMSDALSGALCDVLAQCDFARFSSASVSDADMQGLLARAEHLWSDVAAFSPAVREGA